MVLVASAGDVHYIVRLLRMHEFARDRDIAPLKMSSEEYSTTLANIGRIVFQQLEYCIQH